MYVLTLSHTHLFLDDTRSSKTTTEQTLKEVPVICQGNRSSKKQQISYVYVFAYYLITYTEWNSCHFQFIYFERNFGPKVAIFVTVFKITFRLMYSFFST